MRAARHLSVFRQLEQRQRDHDHAGIRKYSDHCCSGRIRQSNYTCNESEYVTVHGRSSIRERVWPCRERSQAFGLSDAIIEPGTNWDPNRKALDSTGYITKLLAKMPTPNNYDIG